MIAQAVKFCFFHVITTVSQSVYRCAQQISKNLYISVIGKCSIVWQRQVRNYPPIMNVINPSPFAMQLRVLDYVIPYGINFDQLPSKCR